jgi:hypothetical protein
MPPSTYPVVRFDEPLSSAADADAEPAPDAPVYRKVEAFFFVAGRFDQNDVRAGIDRQLDTEAAAAELDAVALDGCVARRLGAQRELQLRQSRLEHRGAFGGERNALVVAGELLQGFAVALPSGCDLTELFATAGDVEHRTGSGLEAVTFLEALASGLVVFFGHRFAAGLEQRLGRRPIARLRSDVPNAREPGDDQRRRQRPGYESIDPSTHRHFSITDH